MIIEEVQESYTYLEFYILNNIGENWQMRKCGKCVCVCGRGGGGVNHKFEFSVWDFLHD